jgi:hypothetical protein
MGRSAYDIVRVFFLPLVLIKLVATSDNRRYSPYLPRQSQTQPWTSKVGDLPTAFSFYYHRGPSAMGDIRRITSQALGTIAEDPQVPTEQNPPRSTNTYSLPDFSTTSESSQEAEDKKTAPAEKEASAAAPSRSTNTYSLPDFLSTSESSQEDESENLAPAEKKVPVAAARSRSTNTFSVPEKHIESSDSSDSADHYINSPTVSSARETTATDVVPTSTSNVSSAIQEPPVSPDKVSTVPSSPHAVHNTSSEPIHSPAKDTTILHTNGSEGSWSPSRQLHEFAQEQPQGIPVNCPPASQEPTPHATEKEQEAEGTSSPSPDLRDAPRSEEEISVAGTPDTPNPQTTSAATGSEEAIEQPPTVPRKTSPPTPPRRSVRQRRQPERYASAPAQRREVIKREPEDKGKTTKSTTKSPNKRKRQDKHKNADLEREAPAKRQKRSEKGRGAIRKKPSPLLPFAGLSASETVGVSARGRMRKVPQKYGP